MIPKQQNPYTNLQPGHSDWFHKKEIIEYIPLGHYIGVYIGDEYLQGFYGGIHECLYHRDTFDEFLFLCSEGLTLDECPGKIILEIGNDEILHVCGEADTDGQECLIKIRKLEEPPFKLIKEILVN